MLNESEKEKLRGVLKAHLEKLQGKSASALTFSMNHERNIGRDSIDESMEEEIFSTEMRLHDREKYLLGKIKKQIARLETGSIDECEECGESISFKRLMARPVTTLCIDCKERSEREEQALAQAGRGGAGFEADEAEDSSGGPEYERGAAGASAED
jgi:DnaK suppressor protein